MDLKRIALVNGPNLNMLGTRQPEIYGSTTLKEIEDRLKSFVSKSKTELVSFQSNHEGAIIDFLQSLDKTTVKGVILNPGALMMNGFGLYDAIANLDIPVIEVHISNIYRRESFRHKSILASVCDGQITGLGVDGYHLAAEAMLRKIAAT